jgi:hypothetical protein
MVRWAQTIGPNTAGLFERIVTDKPHPEKDYLGCLGIILRIPAKPNADSGGTPNGIPV